MNLLKETLEAVEGRGNKVSDILFVGSLDGKYRLSWAEFKKIADVDYDSGFGAQEVAKDLIVCFKDMTYMRRGEYDGSEWWEFNRPIKLGKTWKPFTRALVRPEEIGWKTVAESNS